jgi:hypothetical protein
MIRRSGPPSQTWRPFLENHAMELIALDAFAVPTATFRVLFVLVILNQDRRRFWRLNHLASRQPDQNGFDDRCSGVDSLAVCFPDHSPPKTTCGPALIA